MAQAVSYEVRMVRPDRKRTVIRRYFDVAPIQAKSVAQLAGFLTHKLFADKERGKEGTHYIITERRADGTVDVVTVRRTAWGTYVHV